MLLSSCTATRYVSTTDTVRLYRTVADTIRLTDSVAVETFRLGDTVYRTLTRTRYRDRTVWRTVGDTCVRHATEASRQPATTERRGETVWQKAKRWGTLAGAAIAGLAVVAVLFKRN